MLAVVQHEQPLAPGERGDQCRILGERQLLGHADHFRHGPDDGSRLGNPDQVDEPHPIAMPRSNVARDADRQPRLADPARADRRDEPLTGQGVRQLGALRRPAQEGRRGHRQHAALPSAIDAGTARQAAPVRHVELAQQRSHVAFRRAYRDEQRRGDLRVRQMLTHQREYLGFASRDLVAGCPHALSVPRDGSVRSRRP